jgi:hypothetical protein
MERFLLCYGSYDSHAFDKLTPKAGTPYETISFQEIVARAQNPTAFEKLKAPAIIPSTYAGPDGRSFDVQRKKGRFGLVCADVDSGDHDLETIGAAIQKLTSGSGALIYSSASASASNKKWRAIIPLASLLPGYDYPHVAEALFDELRDYGIDCDYALSRVGQLVYLPNVPYERRENGFPTDPPLFYEYKYFEGQPFDPFNSALQKRIRDIQEEMKREEEYYQQEQAAASTRRHMRPVDEGNSIEIFNRENNLHDILQQYGYKPDRRGNYRSPNQSGNTFATKVFGEYWVSLSTSDTAIGQASRSGNRFGDAFDLYAYYEHSGDFRAALTKIKAQHSQEKVRASFSDDAHQRRERQRADNQDIGSGKSELDPPFPSIVTLEEAEQRFVFISDGSRIVDTRNPRSDLSLQDFKNSIAASKVVLEIEGANGALKKVEKSVANLFVKSPARMTCETKTFAPGDGIFTTDPHGRRALNIWRPYERPHIEDYIQRAQPFLDHITFLFAEQAGGFLDWLAHIEQKPGELPSTGWVHISRHTGTGRNLISSIISRIWCGHVAASVNLAELLGSQFNERLAQKIVAVVDEIREGGGNRWNASERLKSIVTEEVRQINPKYGRQYTEWNACRWLIFSNHKSALPLDQSDRRFEVVECRFEPRDADYYKSLYALVDDPIFIQSVALVLKNRDISGFNPGKRAEMSDAKIDMIEANETETKQWLRLLKKHYPSDIISTSLLRWFLAGMVSGELCSQNFNAEQRRSMEDLDFTNLGNLRLGSNPERFYAIRNGTYWKSTEGRTKLRSEYSKRPKGVFNGEELREYLSGRDADGGGDDDIF